MLAALLNRPGHHNRDLSAPIAASAGELIQWHANRIGQWLAGLDAGAAMQVPTVKACVDLIAGHLASLPLRAVRTTGDGTGTGRPLNPQPQWLQRPEPEVTRGVTIGQIAAGLVLDGNAFAMVTRRNADGSPNALMVLDSIQVTVERDDRTGMIAYKVAGGYVPPPDMIHFRTVGLPGQDYGIGLLQAGARTIAMALAEDEFAANRFSADPAAGAGLPDLVISYPGELAPGSGNRIADEFQARHVGTRRRVGVLDNGASATMLGWSAEQLQLVPSRQWSARAVCTLAGVPPHLVGLDSGSSLTYSTREQDQADFAQRTLRRYGSTIEDGFSAQTPRGQGVRFDYPDAYRPTPRERFELHKTALAAGFRTVDEVRAEEGWETMTELESDQPEVQR